MVADGIIIRVGKMGDKFVPKTPTNLERYKMYAHKRLMAQDKLPVNTRAWNFRNTYVTQAR